MNPELHQVPTNMSNTTNSSQEASLAKLNTENLRTVKLALYAVIFFVSALGNTLVCVVILKRKKMKTVTNYFILNLAIADLALTCVCIPFDVPVQEMSYVWPYGAFMCKILYPLQTLTLYASVYTLMTVSLTRYWAIVHPLRQQLTISRAKFIMVAIWVVSLFPVAPYVNSLRYVPHSKYCDEIWTNNDTRKGYTVFLFATQYVFPLFVISTAYLSIMRELRRRKLVSSCPSTQQQKETSKVVRMLIVVTLLFAVCVLPNNIMWLWLDFGQADKHFSSFWDVIAFGHVLTFSNSAANPLCYTILNENYRKEIKLAIREYRRKRDRRRTDSDPSQERSVRKDSVLPNAMLALFIHKRKKSSTTQLSFA